MNKNRFFINNFDLKNGTTEIKDPDVIHQAKNVLRLKEGDEIRVFNNHETELYGKIKKMGNREITLSIEKIENKKDEQEFVLELCFSLIKKDKIEYVIQKCTEIGVSEFSPIISERTEKTGYNLERFNKIIKEAAEQSGRTKLPQINTPQNLREFLFQHETEKNIHPDVFYLNLNGSNLELDNLKKTAKNSKCKKITFFIGPEGGWGNEDLKIFEEKGVKSISLGKNTLRAETASIAISAIILLAH